MARANTMSVAVISVSKLPIDRAHRVLHHRVVNYGVKLPDRKERQENDSKHPVPGSIESAILVELFHQLHQV